MAAALAPCPRSPHIRRVGRRADHSSPARRLVRACRRDQVRRDSAPLEVVDGLSRDLRRFGEGLLSRGRRSRRVEVSRVETTTLLAEPRLRSAGLPAADVSHQDAGFSCRRPLAQGHGQPNKGAWREQRSRGVGTVLAWPSAQYGRLV